MASPFDDLDRQHLLAIHKLVDTMVAMLAVQQRQIDILIKRKNFGANARRYLRHRNQELREQLAQSKAYTRQLENELRLRGLE